MFNFTKDNRGQALVTLIIFMVVAITITSAGVIAAIMNSRSATALEQGTLALQTANSGAENAILRLIRNPTYTGETITIGDGVATITVTGSNPATILSVGQVGNFVRKVQVNTSGISFLTITSWREIH